MIFLVIKAQRREREEDTHIHIEKETLFNTPPFYFPLLRQYGYTDKQENNYTIYLYMEESPRSIKFGETYSEPKTV